MSKITINDNTWVEINDPHTAKVFYANPKTGECSWERPKNSNLQPRDPRGEWWELWDEANQLPYYYHTLTGQTEWILPESGTIIPLTKIQNSSIGKRISMALTPDDEDDLLQSNLAVKAIDINKKKPYSDLLSVNDAININYPKLNINTNNSNNHDYLLSPSPSSSSSSFSNNNDILLYPQNSPRSFKSSTTFDSNMLSETTENMNNNGNNNNNYNDNNNNNSNNSNNNSVSPPLSPVSVVSFNSFNFNSHSDSDNNHPSKNTTTTATKKSFIKKKNKQQNGNHNNNNSSVSSGGGGNNNLGNSAFAATKSILKKASKRSLKSLLSSSASSNNCNKDNNNDDGDNVEEIANINISNGNDYLHHHNHNQFISQSISSIETDLSSSSTLLPSRSMTPTAFLNQLLGNGDKVPLKGDRGEELITFKHVRNTDNDDDDDDDYDDDDIFKRDLKFELKLSDYSSSNAETDGKLKGKEDILQQNEITQNSLEKKVPEKSNDDAKINGPTVNFETAMRPTIVSCKNNSDDTKEKRKEFHFHTRRLSTGEVMTLPPELQNEINKFSIDGFARKYFGTHKKGIFRRKVPVEKMLLFQKDSIRQPLLVLNENIQKDAIKCFKVIRYIMGDRSRGRLNLNNNISTVNNNVNGDINNSIHSKQNYLMSIQWLLDRGIFLGELRDEIYVQIYKQLNNNPNSGSIKKGWELLCVITITFPPSKNLESHLMRFISDNLNRKENQIDVYSKHVYSRLTRICKKGPRGKVLTLGEIERAMEAPFNPSVFGETLDFIMGLQSHTLPTLKIPRILPFLADSILELKGQSIEGIFRVPGDADYVTELKLRIERNKYDITGITDPHVPASLLKFWLRELAEPLIPNNFYERCIKNSEDKVQTIEIIKQLPDINRKVVTFIVNFLQLFAEPETCKITKMHVSNLAMIFAPNFLRCPSDHLGVILKNTKYEQTFVRTLILNLKNDHINHGGTVNGTNNGADNSNINGHANNTDTSDSESVNGLDILKNYKNLIKNNQIQQQQSSYLQEGTVSGGQHQLS